MPVDLGMLISTRGTKKVGFNLVETLGSGGDIGKIKAVQKITGIGEAYMASYMGLASFAT